MTNRLLTGGECPQGVLDVIEGSIGYLALSCGFTSIEYAALRILSNILLSFTEDVGVAALGFAESTGRTTILLSDIVLALVDLGFDVHQLEELPRRRQYRGFKEPVAVGATNNRAVSCTSVIGPSGAVIIPKPLLSLRSEWSGANRGMCTISSNPLHAAHGGSDTVTSVVPPMAPTHLYLPVLPEPHTYMRTLTKRPPVVTDPASFRRRVADQRRKVQKSLTQFLARIHPVQYLFHGDPESFMLLIPRKTPRPYMDALLTEPRPESPTASADETVAPTTLFRSKTNLTMKSSNSTAVSNPYLLKPKFPKC